MLLSGMRLYFSDHKFNVYYQKQVPANDGGLSLGQAEIARALSKMGVNAVKYTPA
jgi:hydrogenase maturation factor HypF (carbamoyltransferase family)